MSVKTRLNKLERPIDGDWCPHQPALVRYGDDGTGERGHQSETQWPESQCPCGLPQMKILVEYVSGKKPDADEFDVVE